jgi:hypothetical protein
VVGRFDVLERIPDHVYALRNLKKALKLGGLLLISVPQQMWSLSEQDEHARHQRRYGRGELVARARDSGFGTTFAASFCEYSRPICALAQAQ